MVEKPNTLDCFTKSSRTVLVNARIEAQQLNHREIGTEHILMALLKEPALAVVFNELSVNPQSVYSTLRKVYKPGRTGLLLPSPNKRASQAAQLAVTEANMGRRSQAEPTDLLIGILRVAGGVNIPAELLREQEVTADRVRFAVRSLQKRPQLPSAPEAQPKKPEKTVEKTPEEIAGSVDTHLKAILNNPHIHKGAKDTLLKYIDKDLKSVEKNAPKNNPYS